MRSENVISPEQRLFQLLKETVSAGIALPTMYLLIRRYVEIIIIFISLPLIVPVFVLISIPVIFCFKGKIFYKQKRAGTNGIPFTIYKFKTMKDVSEDDYNYFNHCNERITGLGGFLRRHRIDELPQILNVLKGDMSFVGPRPEIYELHTFFSGTIINYNFRKIIPQGITGWAQINFPHTVSIEGNREKLKYDLFYLNNLSLKMDIQILLKTLLIVFTGEKSE